MGHYECRHCGQEYSHCDCGSVKYNSGALEGASGMTPEEISELTSKYIRTLGLASEAYDKGYHHAEKKAADRIEALEAEVAAWRSQCLEAEFQEAERSLMLDESRADVKRLTPKPFKSPPGAFNTAELFDAVEVDGELFAPLSMYLDSIRHHSMTLARLTAMTENAETLAALVHLVHSSFGGGLAMTFTYQDVHDFADTLEAHAKLMEGK